MVAQLIRTRRRLGSWPPVLVLALALFTGAGCVSSRNSDAELAAFAAEYTYLDPNAGGGLGDYFAWQKIFPGRLGSPIRVSIVQGEWVRLKEPPQTEYQPPLPSTYECEIRVTVEINGQVFAFRETAMLSHGSAMTTRRAAIDQVARRTLRRVHELAIGTGIVAQR